MYSVWGGVEGRDASHSHLTPVRRLMPLTSLGRETPPEGERGSERTGFETPG